MAYKCFANRQKCQNSSVVYDPGTSIAVNLQRIISYFEKQKVVS